MRTQQISEPLYRRLYATSVSKADQRRTEIALAAYDLVNEGGIDAVTFDSVGAELGLKSAHIAYYFKSKRELLAAVFKVLVIKAQDLYVAALKGSDSSERLLEKYVAASFEGLIRQKNSRSNVALFFYYASVDPACREVYLQAKESGVERIATILSRSSDGNATKHEKLEGVAEEIFTMIQGRVLQSIIHAEDKLVRRFQLAAVRDAKKIAREMQ